MPKERRRTFWVENKVQGVLARRLLAYWFVTWLSILGLTLLSSYAYSLLYSLVQNELPVRTGVRQALGYFWLPMLVSFLVMPIIFRDYMRLSHRFAGPMLTFRRAIQQLVAGQTVEPVQLRKDDYWQEFAEDFNRLLVFVQANQTGVEQDDSAKEERQTAELAEAESELAGVSQE